MMVPVSMNTLKSGLAASVKVPWSVPVKRPHKEPVVPLPLTPVPPASMAIFKTNVVRRSWVEHRGRPRAAARRWPACDATLGLTAYAAWATCASWRRPLAWGVLQP